MPGLDGLEVARRLRDRGFEGPIILCSAYLNPEIERAARAVGASTVSKSDQQELLETVRREVTA
jgi:CheY-like chemotaxis protein